MMRMMAMTGGVVCAVILAACGDDLPPDDNDPVLAAGAVLVRIDAASATACPHGGSVISSGLDTNQNSVLEDAEIQVRTPVCNPLPVEPGPPPEVLVRLAAEPAGANCSEGGTAVQSGLDRNGNAELDPDEVTHVDYVCGERLLTRLAAEPPGARCVAGGVVFFIGRDRDHDDQLDDGEVEHTEYQCGDVLTRDVTVALPADAAALAGIAVVQGNLTITGAAVEDVAFPRLLSISGSVTVHAAPQLAQVAAPELIGIGGDLRVDGNAKLDTLALPKLAQVGRDLVVNDSTSLASVTLPALTRIGRDVEIENNPVLETVDLPVKSIGGGLRVSETPRWRTLAWTLEDHLSRATVFSSGLSSLTLSVRGATQEPVLGEVLVFGNPELQILELTASSVTSLSLSHDPKLTTVRVHAGTVTQDVTISQTDVLANVQFDAGASLQPFQVRGSLRLQAPVSVLDAGIWGMQIHGICELFDTQLTSLGALNAVSRLILAGNHKLTVLRGVVVGSLDVSNNDVLSSITLAQHSVGAARISRNPALEEVLLGTVEHLQGLELSFNPKLARVRAPELIAADGSLEVTDNALLTVLAMPELLSIGETLFVHNNPGLRSLALPSLVSGGQVFVAGNTTLGELSLPQLTRVESISVTSNPVLPACEVDALFAQITGTHSQRDNDETASCAP